MKYCCSVTDSRNRADFLSFQFKLANKKKAGRRIAACKFARIKSGRRIVNRPLHFQITVNSGLADTPLLRTLDITDKIQIPKHGEQRNPIRSASPALVAGYLIILFTRWLNQRKYCCAWPIRRLNDRGRHNIISLLFFLSALHASLGKLRFPSVALRARS